MSARDPLPRRSSGQPLVPTQTSGVGENHGLPSLRSSYSGGPSRPASTRNMRPRGSSGMSKSSDYGQLRHRRPDLNLNPFDLAGPDPLLPGGGSPGPQSGIVEVLKEKLRATLAERDAFAAELEKHRKLTRATRVSELESRIEMLSEECERHRNVQMLMRERMQQAEMAAHAATDHAKRSMDTLRQYMNEGKMPDPTELKLKGQNAMTASRTTATLDTMRACHMALLSQAVTLKTNTCRQGVITNELTMAEFAERVQRLGPNFVGAVDVLRYLQVHVRRMATEMMGLPGSAALAQSLSLVPSKSTYPYTVFLARQMGTIQELGFAIGDHLHQLRPITSEDFSGMHTLFRSDIRHLEDMSELLVAETKRLRGADEKDKEGGQAKKGKAEGEKDATRQAQAGFDSQPSTTASTASTATTASNAAVASTSGDGGGGYDDDDDDEFEGLGGGEAMSAIEEGEEEGGMSRADSGAVSEHADEEGEEGEGEEEEGGMSRSDSEPNEEEGEEGEGEGEEEEEGEGEEEEEEELSHLLPTTTYTNARAPTGLEGEDMDDEYDEDS